MADELQTLRAEVERLRALINTPHTADYMEAVRLEAAHQQERWGSEHDAGKAPADWFWLLGYLSGKALAAFVKGDREKGLHHIISSAAALLNWHRAATGEMTAMRPGIAPPANGVQEDGPKHSCKNCAHLSKGSCDEPCAGCTVRWRSGVSDRWELAVGVPAGGDQTGGPEQ